MDSLTTEQALFGGAVIGGFIATVLIAALIYYILLAIACWKIFAKAGEPGWKALIPIYNTYTLYKITGISFWLWCLLPVIIASVFSTMAQNGGDLQVLWQVISSCILLIVDIKLAIGVAKSFGKGTGFTIGLILLTNIFLLILGFGSAKYLGAQE